MPDRGIAQAFHARGVARRIARDDGKRVDHAEIVDALQRSVTEVAILGRRAVRINDACARIFA